MIAVEIYSCTIIAPPELEEPYPVIFMSLTVILLELLVLSASPELANSINLPLPSPVNIVDPVPAPSIVRFDVPSGIVISSSLYEPAATFIVVEEQPILVIAYATVANGAPEEVPAAELLPASST